MPKNFFTPDDSDVLSRGAYQLIQHGDFTYLLISDMKARPIPTVKVSRVLFNSDETATLIYIDEWFGFSDAAMGAVFDAQKLSE